LVLANRARNHGEMKKLPLLAEPHSQRGATNDGCLRIRFYKLPVC
jgi:hypothetical protein